MFSYLSGAARRHHCHSTRLQQHVLQYLKYDKKSIGTGSGFGVFEQLNELRNWGKVPRSGKSCRVWHLCSSVRAELNVFNNYDERYSSPTYQHTHTYIYTHTHTDTHKQSCDWKIYKHVQTCDWKIFYIAPTII